jgi:hypothetical protein
MRSTRPSPLRWIIVLNHETCPPHGVITSWGVRRGKTPTDPAPSRMLLPHRLCYKSPRALVNTTLSGSGIKFISNIVSII